MFRVQRGEQLLGPRVRRSPLTERGMSLGPHQADDAELGAELGLGLVGEVSEATAIVEDRNGQLPR